jgi:hypothetical protein
MGLSTKIKAPGNHLYFAGLILLCLGLPLSKFLMSVSQFFLAASWLVDLNYKHKLKLFFHNKMALTLTGLFIIHLLGLLYTTDMKAGLNDVRIKLPLLILPFLFATSPRLTRQQFNWLLGLFVAAVTISTFCSIAVLLGFTRFTVNDIRDISIFISHIRLALLICIALFILLHAIFHSPNSLSAPQKAGLLLVALWLVFFLFIMESVTGILIFFTLGLSMLCYLAFKQRRIFIKIALFILIIILPTAAYFFLQKTIHNFYTIQQVDLQRLPECTALGNPYQHQKDNYQMENGHKVYLYLCMPELEAEWPKRSNINFMGKDERNQDIRYTLIRFLTSKGLRKDADGLNQLSSNEIHSIERGIANVNYQQVSNIRARLDQIIWEYYSLQHNGNPSGHSVTQRFEFWKASIHLIQSNFLVGVGTGDVEKKLADQYDSMQSPLEMRWRLRAHNQFLSIFVAFGIIGFLYFIFSLIYPLLNRLKQRDYFYLVFWGIAVLSMLTEDTLETQAGATFFAFFNALFLFVQPKDEGQ